MESENQQSLEVSKNKPTSSRAPRTTELLVVYCLIKILLWYIIGTLTEHRQQRPSQVLLPTRLRSLVCGLTDVTPSSQMPPIYLLHSHQSEILFRYMRTCAAWTNKHRESLPPTRFPSSLVPRFSLLPVERPWLSLVTCLPESGRLQTNDLREGRISVRFVSTKRRRQGQWKLCILACHVF